MQFEWAVKLSMMPIQWNWNWDSVVSNSYDIKRNFITNASYKIKLIESKKIQLLNNRHLKAGRKRKRKKKISPSHLPTFSSIALISQFKRRPYVGFSIQTGSGSCMNMKMCQSARFSRVVSVMGHARITGWIKQVINYHIRQNHFLLISNRGNV